MSDTTIRPPTLYEIKQLKEDWGLVGEADTHQVVFLSFLGGGLVIMTGLSSGGKDAVVNAAEYCVPDNWVYKMPTSMTESSFFEKNEEINACPVHRHKDISSIKKDYLEDTWKAHGQDDAISRTYNDVTGEERGAVEQTLHPPKCMILFLASDNEQVDLNDYAEVRNRALVVGIDDSRQLTKKVNTRQAKQRAHQITYNLDETRTQEIREYVDDIPVHLYGDNANGGFDNQVAPALDNQNPLPQHFTEARRDWERLLDFTQSVTLFRHTDRMEVGSGAWPDEMRIDDMTTMLVTPEDVWLGMRVFGEKMVLSALNLRDKDFVLLDILRQNFGSQYDVGMLQQMMRREGWNITDSDVRRSLKNMKVKGYVRVDKTTTPHEWSASEFAREVDRGVNLDWPTIIEDTKDYVHQYYPSDVAEEYERKYLEGEGLLVTHPFTGDTINLADEHANELEQKVEQQEEKEADTAFGEEEVEPDNDQQGTLDAI